MKPQTVTLSYLRMAPRKVRSVADLIRGLSANEAEAQLLVQRRRPSLALLKLLRSAVANVKNNDKQVNPDHLFISEIRVDGGPMLKRSLPRARGSASPIQKKMSHVTLTLDVNEKLSSRFTIVTKKKLKAEEKRAAKKERPVKEKRVMEKERIPAPDLQREIKSS
jgi:large subunit ribosomal protein L22